MRDRLPTQSPCLCCPVVVARWVRTLGLLLLPFVVLAVWGTFAPPAAADTPAGYQTYVIPGGEDQLWDIFVDMDDYDLDVEDGMHAVISVVAGADNTTVYYDHWEDGYDFDPADPSTADETVLLNRGETRIFESAAIPIPRSAAQTYYDGRDRIYTAGGAVTVNRASWTESAGTLYALAWEIYPVQALLTQTAIPIGVDLAPDYGDFEEVYVIVQATEDGTQVEIDDPSNGVTSQTIDRGGVAQRYGVSAGTTVSATAPVQVQFIVGTDGTVRGHYEVRGFTAVPEDLWDDEYYVPVGSFSDDRQSDAYLYNPSATELLTITWEEPAASGTFTIPPGSTLSYEDGRGATLPVDGGVYLRGSHPFWGVASVDTESSFADWGYSLIPAGYLTNDYTIGWAPSSVDRNAPGSAVFAAASQDDTVVFMDYDADGTADDQVTLDRLQYQKIEDAESGSDFDMTGAHIWANQPLAVVWGADPTVGDGGGDYFDLGYTTLPFRDAWMDLVLTLDKVAGPSFVPPGVGARTTFTLRVESHDVAVDDVDGVDMLPADWDYVDDSTTIIFPDGSQATGAAADPTTGGQTLTWDLNYDLSAGEALTIAFEAETSAVLATDYSLNQAEATGMQGSQTWSTEASALVYVSDLTVAKLSSAGGSGVQAGDALTYTIVVDNVGGVTQRNVLVSDPLPEGTTYVADSSWVTASLDCTFTYLDQFEAAHYQNSDGTSDWRAYAWEESGDDGDPGQGWIRIQNGRLRFRGEDSSSAYAIERQVDLAGATTAFLHFDYDVFEWSGDALVVSVYDGSVWHDVRTLSGIDQGSVQHEISDWAGADTRIRFRAVGFEDRWWILAEYGAVDDVRIEYSASARPGGAPPALVGEGCDLAPDETLTVTFQVAVDAPPPAGLSHIANTVSVTSDELTEQLTDRAIEPLLTTAVRLAAFAAQPRVGEILVTWETALEIDNVGFNLYRAPAAGGPSTQLNDALIPAQHPGSTFGARYQWVDRDVEPGVTYVYRLEDLDRAGARTMHGPVRAALPLAAGGAVHTTYLPLVFRESGAHP